MNISVQEVIQATDKNIPVTITNDDGTPVNITGYTVYYTAKIYLTDPDASALISEDVTVHSEPAAGKTNIPLSDTQTNVPAGVYHTDIKLKDGAGNLTATSRGMLWVKHAVTLRGATP